MSHRSISLLCVFILTGVWVSCARGQYTLPDINAPQFFVDFGYMNINLSGSSLGDQSGVRIMPAVDFSPIKALPQLRLGADVGVSLALSNSSHVIIVNGGQLTAFSSSDVPLWTLEPEATLSWRQPIGSSFFVEPGIAGGGMFGFLDLNPQEPGGASYSASDQTGYGRVFVRAGFQIPIGNWGFDASYAAGGPLNFGGNIHGDVSEFYFGMFGALRF